MNKSTRFRDRLRAFANPQAMSVDDFLHELSLANQSDSGSAVNESTAMKVGAFFAAVRVLTESIASLPLEVYRRLEGGGKERATEERIYNLLHSQPNSWQTSFEFRELLTYHLIMRGNAYAYKSRAGGVVRELIPINPDQVVVEQDANYRLTYKFIPAERSKIPVLLTQEDVVHIRGLSIDGVTGVSLLTWGREVIGGALGQQKHGNRLWKNGANPGMALMHPQTLSENAHKRLRESFDQRYSGSDNAGKTLIVEEGMKIERLSMTNDDAQFLESRKFSRSEISGITRVPPHMIGDLERATFSNIEHQDLAFVKHALRPWLVRWEQALTRDLFRGSDLLPEFNVDGLARGDLKSRYQAYAIGRNWGWLSANDIREKENLNPIEGGDEYLHPLNMQPVGEEVPDGLKSNPESGGGKE